MTTWIALLRGINVGGNRKVPMARLRELCEEQGLGDVRTYIASGNVLFTSKHRSGRVVADLVSDVVEAEHGFRIQVVVRSLAQLREAVAESPQDDIEHRAVGFLTDVPTAAAVKRAQAAMIEPSVLEVVGAQAHLLVPLGLGADIVRSPGLEKLLGVGVTVRNRRTVAKLLELAEDLG